MKTPLQAFVDRLRSMILVQQVDLGDGHSDDDLFRAQMVHYSSFCVGFFLIVVAFFRFFTIERTTSFWTLYLVGAMFVFGPLIYKRFRVYREGAILTIICSFILLFFRSLETGGLQGVSIGWITLLPIIAAFFFGLRGASFAIVVSILFLTFFLFVAEPSGWVTKINDSSSSHYIVLSILVLTHGFLAITYEKQRHKNEERIKKTLGALARARKLASLGTIAGGIAHEINNPMMIILGNVEQIKRVASAGDLTSKQCEDLKRRCDAVEQNVLNIRSIIDALLLIGRSRPEVNFQQFSALEILEASLKALDQGKHKNKDIQICGDDLSFVELSGNKVLLTQLLVNLLTNAFDATEGRENIRVWVEVKLDRDWLELRVCDNGGPLSEEMKEALFNPFFTSKPVGQGTGLGLTLSKTIAEIHQGELNFLGDEPVTTFCLKLPLVNISR